MKGKVIVSSVRKALARSAPLKAAYHGLRSGALAAACRVSPDALTRARYRLAWGRWPDFAKPTTFDEKLLWLNLYWQNPLKARCGDKFTVRGFVIEHHLDHLLPRLFGAYSSTAEVALEALPDRFVMKCSHGCKCNVFCADKRTFDWTAAKRNLDAWMKKDFSLSLGEIHYRSMERRIICEEFLQDDTGHELPTDYKVFCFGGRPYCTMVATERSPNGIPRIAFYDLDWRERLPYCVPELAADKGMPRPAAYDEMIVSAQQLSRPFPFVRMDFYSIGGRARLGEMTFTPGACISADYMTRVGQQELGRLLQLPEPYAAPS